jgi:hypothetical protein
MNLVHFANVELKRFEVESLPLLTESTMYIRFKVQKVLGTLQPMLRRKSSFDKPPSLSLQLCVQSADEVFCSHEFFLNPELLPNTLAKNLVYDIADRLNLLYSFATTLRRSSILCVQST